MKEDALVRLLTLRLWPKETNLCYYIFSFVQLFFPPNFLGVINAEMAGIHIVHFSHNL